MIYCDWTSLIITGLFFIIIMALVIWSSLKSRIQNCCKNKTAFSQCKSNFGKNFDMNSDTNYNTICANSS
jgi:hypothetical protein